MLTLGMIAAPYVGRYLYTRAIDDPDRAVRAGGAFFATYGLLMLAVGMIFWLASILTSVITFTLEPRALCSPHGVFVFAANIAALCYAIYFFQ